VAEIRDKVRTSEEGGLTTSESETGVSRSAVRLMSAVNKTK